MDKDKPWLERGKKDFIGGFIEMMDKKFGKDWNILMETKWIEFRELDPKPKTRVFQVWSKCSDCELGIIHWYPSWRHYTFSPTIKYKTEHSDRCMIDIGIFVRGLNEIHKEELKRKKNVHESH